MTLFENGGTRDLYLQLV